jgi:hypothetical protein
MALPDVKLAREVGAAARDRDPGAADGSRTGRGREGAAAARQILWPLQLRCVDEERLSEFVMIQSW